METLEQIKSQLGTEVGEIKAKWYIDRAIASYQHQMVQTKTCACEGITVAISQDES